MKTATVTKRMIISALAGTIMIPGSAITAQAKENDTLPIAGIESVLAECYQSDWQHPIELYLVPTEQEEYSNMVFANVEDFLYVRKEPDEDSEWLGKLYKGGVATAVGTEGDYTLIRSGSVEGYVLTDQLYTGGAAKEYALQAAQKQATVTAYVLNVRSGQGTEYEILTQITKDQTYQVTGEAVDGWYPIRAGETDGWVSGEYVTVTDSFTYAESREEEQARIAAEEAQKAAEEAAAQAEAQRALEAAQVRSSGQAVIDYACQFIGNPYVWGGTSLTNGADCSGFVQAVYQNFGISLPRTSAEMRSAGYEVSYENAMPGDIMCYDGHVGLYMGDGTIVNAIDEAHGIGISNATYTNIITIRRMF